MTHKNLLSWYSRLRISTQNEEVSSFCSETSMEVSSLTPLHSAAFQSHVSPQLVSLSFLFNAVIHFDMLGKSTDVNT